MPIFKLNISDDASYSENVPMSTEILLTYILLKLNTRV